MAASGCYSDAKSAFLWASLFLEEHADAYSKLGTRRSLFFPDVAVHDVGVGGTFNVSTGRAGQRVEQCPDSAEQ